MSPGALAALAFLLLLLGPPPEAVAGSVSGSVVFRGEPPALPPIEVLKDRETCGHSVPSDALVVSPKNGGVRNTVVFLEGVPAPAQGEPGEVVLENRRCRFVPHVIALRVGAELAIVNRDPVLHNLRAWLAEAQRNILNVVQPNQEQETRRTIKRPGVMTLTCDTHVHMAGHILAFGHPYFAVTGEDGGFRIDGVPPGTYRITAWHEGWTVLRRTPEGRPVHAPPHVLSRSVAVPDTGGVQVVFELPASQ